MIEQEFLFDKSALISGKAPHVRPWHYKGITQETTMGGLRLDIYSLVM